MVYKTTDIYLASCLKLKGFNLRTIDVIGNKGTFVFDEVPQSVLTEYDLGQMLVEPVSYSNTIKQLTTSVRRMSQNKS